MAGMLESDYRLREAAAERLAPLRVLPPHADTPGPGDLPCVSAVTVSGPGGGARRCVVTVWGASEWLAEEGARACFRLLNGWLPPRRWGKLTASVGAPTEAENGVWGCEVTVVGMDYGVIC